MTIQDAAPAPADPPVVMTTNHTSLKKGSCNDKSHNGGLDIISLCSDPKYSDNDDHHPTTSKRSSGKIPFGRKAGRSAKKRTRLVPRKKSKTTGSTKSSATVQRCPNPTSSQTNFSSSSDSKFPSRVIEEGERVFCKWPLPCKDGKIYWYWGKVIKRHLKKSRYFMYDVHFDDGDKLFEASSSNMITETEYNAQMGRPPTVPAVQVRTFASSTKVPVWCGAWSLQEIHQKACGKCENCIKPPCNHCKICRDKDTSSVSLCFQKMCIEIKVEKKFQPLPSSLLRCPDGWVFAFDSVNKRFPEAKGLVLTCQSNTKLYANLEKAKNQNSKALAMVSKETFYHFVGLPELASTSHIRKNKRPANTELQPVQKEQRTRGLSLRQLYERRCKSCAMCIKPDCGHCVGCKDNLSHTRTFRDVCVQKMCCQLAEKDKIQIAKGFPTGWDYYFSETSVNMELTFLNGLVILSPTGARYGSVEDATAELDSGIANSAARLFYRYVGYQGIRELTEDVLLGKSFYQQWMDINGQKKTVYGTIERITRNVFSGSESCTIRVGGESLSSSNAGSSSNGTRLAPTLSVPREVALGGCLNIDENNIRFPGRVPFHHTWNVPDKQDKDFVFEEGFLVPRLTLEYRRFKLVFTTKKSNIPNAGMGVFVQCTPLTTASDANTLTLREGELLDLGLYAPLRREDRKGHHIFTLKNWIFAFNPSEWGFDTTHGDDHFDVTCDSTGELHELARTHIPAYVNETDGRSFSTIFPQHDPEGCVHYLFGHSEEGSGPLTLPSNGEEMEVFVDYGEQYEDVRIRKRYSRLAAYEAKKRLAELEGVGECLDTLEVLRSFNATDILQSVSFMTNAFRPMRRYPGEVVCRALLATVLFRKQAESYILSFDSLSPEEMQDVCMGGFTQEGMGRAVQKCKKLIEHLFGFCRNWEVVKEHLLSDEVHTASLEFILGDKHDFDEMSPRKFEELMTGLATSNDEGSMG